MSRGQATKFIKVSDEFSNDSPVNHLGIKALYSLATIPEEQREEEFETSSGEMKKPIDMTNRELEDLKRQLKQRDEQNAQLQSQVEQAQRSESIARKQLEDEQNREPEVIEREVIKEVVPDEIQQQLEQFKQKFERENNNANELRDELQRYRNSFGDPNQAYEEKELTRLERESSINAHKISISIQNFIKENSVETYRLDTVIKANTKSKERLQENVALLKEFTTNLEAMLNGRIVVN
jgi:similar to ORF2 from streptococcus thermophilus bacteriophage 7201